jgi:hypothetical protein
VFRHHLGSNSEKKKKKKNKFGPRESLGHPQPTLDHPQVSDGVGQINGVADHFFYYFFYIFFFKI